MCALVVLLSEHCILGSTAQFQLFTERDIVPTCQHDIAGDAMPPARYRTLEDEERVSSFETRRCHEGVHTVVIPSDIDADCFKGSTNLRGRLIMRSTTIEMTSFK